MTALSIPISKAARNIGISDEMWENMPAVSVRQVIEAGFKALLNAGMSKITGLKDMEGVQLDNAHEAAYEIAQARLQALNEGTLKSGRTVNAAGKISREENTFITNEVKAMIKAVYKNAGKKLPAKASVLTQAAKDFIADTGNGDVIAGLRKKFAELKAKAAPIDLGALGDQLKGLLDKAENVKPKVPPTRKKKAPEGEDEAPVKVAGAVAAAKTKGKGRPEGGGVRAH